MAFRRKRCRGNYDGQISGRFFHRLGQNRIDRNRDGERARIHPRLGDGSGPKLGLRFNDKAAPAFLLLDPELNFSEMYMDGRIEVTHGTIFDVLMLNAANMWRPDGSLWVFLLGKMRSALRQTLHGPTLACGTRPCPRGRPPRRRETGASQKNQS